MPDFVHWSAALLALYGLLMWTCSVGIRVPQTADSAPSRARLKRHTGRVALFAAVISALLQAAGGPAARTQVENVDIWASASRSRATRGRLDLVK